MTTPSRPMLEAALTAPTGDDVMGEDPTVKELQDSAAKLFGKEAGLFVPTGTMANLVSLLAHCRHDRAAEIIIGTMSHLCLWEGGNVANLGGIHTKQIREDSQSGQFNVQDIRDAYRTDNDDHYPKTQVLCIENSQNMLGGIALPPTYVNDTLGPLCSELNIALHVDGARIFNAATHHNVPVKELCRAADSVSVCLSKGLGAPLGSVVVGDAECIRLAKRARKRCGGGMRQVGVVAAMGLYALQHNVKLLPDDHRRAQRLAADLSSYGFRVTRNGQVDTNIFYFAIPSNLDMSKEEYQRILRDTYGVKITGGYNKGGELFRVVTHLDITDKDIEYAADAMIRAAGVSTK